MNAKHTPGPWMLIQENHARSLKWRVEARSNLSMSDPGYYEPFTVTLRREEDARLIQSAPDISAALREAINIIEGNQDRIGYVKGSPIARFVTKAKALLPE